MRISLFILLFISALSARSQQLSKLYLDKEDKVSDSVKAYSIMLITERSDKDSVWRVETYTMEYWPSFIGSFKDVNLKTLHGPAQYFTIDRKFNADAFVYTPSIGSFLRDSGLYINGKKEGIWYTFNRDRSQVSTCRFKNDIPDGPQKTITNGIVTSEGTYMKGRKEGFWIENGQELVYKRGQVAEIKKKNEEIEKMKNMKKDMDLVVEAQPPADLRSKFYAFLKKDSDYEFDITNAYVSVQIDENGIVSKPEVVGVSDIKLKQGIEQFFITSGRWGPAVRGKERTPVKSVYKFSIKF